MIVRVIEAALAAAIASAVVVAGAAAIGWVSPGHGIVLIVAVAVAGAALAAVQHLSGVTTLAPVEPAPRTPEVE